ncbi:hypothetical protein GIY62_00895 [Burkholderia plantarii]|uniref:hypothetical protein n=1 Tax=Burkholderia plantarii TaxID=41899 RepID=UPI00272DB8A5|nr:hypothetical protein [Burkholderia plantarii]WLE59296.1 hypothetical protein GIY62_00895 [Burkholderia plantarii]
MKRVYGLAVTALGAAFLQIYSVTASAQAGALAAPTDSVAAITNIVSASSCRSIDWRDRGLAPKSYVVGLSLVFARSVCHPANADVVVASSAASLKHEKTDGLAAYDAIFKQLGMRNEQPGVDTLRHTYLLLLGLGMRESSGKYCEGRDVSQCFNDPGSAEAGLFQTSYGARRADPSLETLFQKYTASQDGCMLDQFKGKLSCKIRKSQNPKCPDATSDVVGTGPGADWQRLTKSCPAFATEYAAVVLRKNGGLKGEFNPIRKQQAQLIPACDAMLQNVQRYVEHTAGACDSLP